jgi:hypothetical protein
MSMVNHVPADDDPVSIIDLVEDCREVSGVLAPYVPGDIRLPAPRTISLVEIDATVAAGAAEWGDYGA